MITHIVIAMNCIINFNIPFFHQCNPIYFPATSAEDCEQKRLNMLKKTTVWSSDPNHPRFLHETTALYQEPQCIKNPNWPTRIRRD